LGLARAGLVCRWQVEIEPYSRRVLHKRWPDVTCYGDVRTFRDIPRVDLICGGFPCQDLSFAGKRAGIEGDRSGLWFEYARILRDARPRWVLIENVPGLLVHDAMRRVVGDWPESGMWDAGEVYELATSARPTCESGSSLWPTAQWPTPHTNCTTGPGSQGRDGGENLQTTAATWPTPAARDWRSERGREATAAHYNRPAGPSLPAFVLNECLSRPDEMSQTPTRPLGGGMTRSGDRQDEPLLPKQAADLMRHCDSRLVPVTHDGRPSSENGQTSHRRLNPRFVEFLMGFPIGWTEL